MGGRVGGVLWEFSKEYYTNKMNFSMKFPHLNLSI